MAERCLYMGSWGRPGMYLRRPDGRQPTHEDLLVEYYRKMEVHVDSTLAPRRRKVMHGRAEGGLPWTGMGLTGVERQRLSYDSDECPQGQFFRHELDSGFTALSWWDRTQGDGRGGINSTLFLEGVRTSDEVLAAGRASFSAVFERLAVAGVAILELPLP